MSKLEMFGVSVTEPMTMVTDYMIAAASLWFASQLLLVADNRAQVSRCAWGIAFIFVGVGALLGGTSHGFVRYLTQGSMDFVWRGGLYSIGFAMFFALTGTVSASIRNRLWRNVFYAYSCAVLLLYTWWLASHDDFLYALLNNVSTFVIIAGLQVWALIRHKTSSAWWILAGVAISFLSAGIQRSGLDLHPHFNHNDLYHVVQIAGLYLFYRGANILQDLGERAAPTS